MKKERKKCTDIYPKIPEDSVQCTTLRSVLEHRSFKIVCCHWARRRHSFAVVQAKRINIEIIDNIVQIVSEYCAGTLATDSPQAS